MKDRGPFSNQSFTISPLWPAKLKGTFSLKSYFLPTKRNWKLKFCIQALINKPIKTKFDKANCLGHHWNVKQLYQWTSVTAFSLGPIQMSKTRRLWRYQQSAPYTSISLSITWHSHVSQVFLHNPLKLLEDLELRGAASLTKFSSSSFIIISFVHV